jgi:hypothetical protein
MKRTGVFLIALIALGLAAGTAFGQEVAGGKNVPQHQWQTFPKQAPEFGTSDSHYVRVSGSEFIPDPAGASTYANLWNPGGGTYLWRGYYGGASSFPHLYGWVHAPGGTALDHIEFDYCNGDATNDLTFNVYDCGYLGDCPSTPVVSLSGPHGTGCNLAASAFTPITVNNNFDEYLLEVIFPSSPTDGTVNFAGAIARFKYQVSPAPATATFADVPTSDFGFQYIEALNASGITGGCGSGNYCPDSPVTRRQMAIFIAKALGLDWGGY